MKTVEISYPELRAAMMLWDVHGRMGKTIPRDEAAAISVEETATLNANSLWYQFHGPEIEPAAPVAAAAAAVATGPELAEGETYCCLMPARDDLRAYHLIFGAESPEQLIYGPDDTIDNSNDHYDGAANTAALLASGKPHPAAAYCRSLGDQWYLPAHAELMAAFVHSPDTFKKDGWYLSSTQDGRNGAWCQDFEYGLSDYSLKDDQRRVRPARRSFI